MPSFSSKPSNTGGLQTRSYLSSTNSTSVLHKPNQISLRIISRSMSDISDTSIYSVANNESNTGVSLECPGRGHTTSSKTQHPDDNELVDVSCGSPSTHHFPSIILEKCDSEENFEQPTELCTSRSSTISPSVLSVGNHLESNSESEGSFCTLSCPSMRGNNTQGISITHLRSRSLSPHLSASISHHNRLSICNESKSCTDLKRNGVSSSESEWRTSSSDISHPSINSNSSVFVDVHSCPDQTLSSSHSQDTSVNKADSKHENGVNHNFGGFKSLSTNNNLMPTEHDVTTKISDITASVLSLNLTHTNDGNSTETTDTVCKASRGAVTTSSSDSTITTASTNLHDSTPASDTDSDVSNINCTRILSSICTDALPILSGDSDRLIPCVAIRNLSTLCTDSLPILSAYTDFCASSGWTSTSIDKHSCGDKPSRETIVEADCGASNNNPTIESCKLINSDKLMFEGTTAEKKSSGNKEPEGEILSKLDITTDTQTSSIIPLEASLDESSLPIDKCNQKNVFEPISSTVTHVEHTRSTQKNEDDWKTPTTVNTATEKDEQVDIALTLKSLAAKAIQEKRVFTVHGFYPSVSLSLRRRGWLEKKHDKQPITSDDDIDLSRWPMDGLTPGSLTGKSGLRGAHATTILSRLLKNHTPNLVWTGRRDLVDFGATNRDQIVNHFPRAPFTTKLGMCSLVGQIHWLSEVPPADSFVPRTYRLDICGERDSFVADFKLTACVSVLQWYREQYKQYGTSGVIDSKSEIPFSVLDTAVYQCQRYISARCHDNIELDEQPTKGKPTQEKQLLLPGQWTKFLSSCHQLLNNGCRLQLSQQPLKDTSPVVYSKVVAILSAMERYRPQTAYDGYRNIWITKPGASCRGRGIVLLNNLESILALGNDTSATTAAATGITVSHAQRHGKYVVQKYMERPLLIYDTKFDIRQWFLVTDWNPLTVWIYKQSYLRFSSQPFTLENLGEVVHLCNNAVQCRYKNAQRHSQLPEQNMWDCSTFQQYLRGQCSENTNIWRNVIYAGMKRAIAAVCLAAQVDLEPRKHCFELFGADFILTPDYRPYLIEVNACPAMGPSTTVTSWLCSLCLEDVIRVVIDRRSDPTADTGDFELLLSEPSVPRPRYSGHDLTVTGRALRVFSSARNQPLTSGGTQRSATTVPTRDAEKVRRSIGVRNSHMHVCSTITTTGNNPLHDHLNHYHHVSTSTTRPTSIDFMPVQRIRSLTDVARKKLGYRLKVHGEHISRGIKCNAHNNNNNNRKRRNRRQLVALDHSSSLLTRENDRQKTVIPVQQQIQREDGRYHDNPPVWIVKSTISQQKKLQIELSERMRSADGRRHVKLQMARQRLSKSSRLRLIDNVVARLSQTRHIQPTNQPRSSSNTTSTDKRRKR